MKKISFLMISVASLILSACNKTPAAPQGGGGGGQPQHTTIECGLYPQSVVSDSSIQEALEAEAEFDASTGWFKYQNELYARLVASPNEWLEDESGARVGAKFLNGQPIYSGTTYWFKCEPIKWIVLSTNEENQAFLFAEKVLDRHVYDTHTSAYKPGFYTLYPNNYRYSSIRTWLNEDFYSHAFVYDSDKVAVTQVINGIYSSGDEGREFIYDHNSNSEDKVFLLSYKDFLNADYGFATDMETRDPAKAGLTTDYSRAIGLGYTTYGQWEGCAWYWSRSPESVNTNYVADGGTAYCVSQWSYLYDMSVLNNFGVRPAITVALPEEE